jgi:hypothetical protein
VSFWAFDLLWLDGDLLVDWPYAERRAALEELPLAGPCASAAILAVAGRAAIDAGGIARTAPLSNGSSPAPAGPAMWAIDRASETSTNIHCPDGALSTLLRSARREPYMWVWGRLRPLGIGRRYFTSIDRSAGGWIHRSIRPRPNGPLEHHCPRPQAPRRLQAEGEAEVHGVLGPRWAGRIDLRSELLCEGVQPYAQIVLHGAKPGSTE